MELKTHPTLEKLLAHNPATVTAISGYIGPGAAPGRVTIYPSLLDLSSYVSANREDIVAVEPAPATMLPFDGVIVWVRDRHQLAFHRASPPTEDPGTNPWFRFHDRTTCDPKCQRCRAALTPNDDPKCERCRSGGVDRFDQDRCQRCRGGGRLFDDENG